jgi:hypothetical protein
MCVCLLESGPPWFLSYKRERERERPEIYGLPRRNEGKKENTITPTRRELGTYNYRTALICVQQYAVKQPATRAVYPSSSFFYLFGCHVACVSRFDVNTVRITRQKGGGEREKTFGYQSKLGTLYMYTLFLFSHWIHRPFCSPHTETNTPQKKAEHTCYLVELDTLFRATLQCNSTDD